MGHSEFTQLSFPWLAPIKTLVNFRTAFVVVEFIRVAHSGADGEPERALAVIQVDIRDGVAAVFERLGDPRSVPELEQDLASNLYRNSRMQRHYHPYL